MTELKRAPEPSAVDSSSGRKSQQTQRQVRRKRTASEAGTAVQGLLDEVYTQEFQKEKSHRQNFV